MAEFMQELMLDPTQTKLLCLLKKHKQKPKHSSRLVYKKVLSVDFYPQSIKQRTNFTFWIVYDTATDFYMLS